MKSLVPEQRTILSLCLLALWVAGCASAPESASPTRKQAVAHLYLFARPVAVRSENARTPDGFVVTLYATRGNNAQGVVIKSGKLEILMFDGVLKDNDPQSATPLHIWTYPAAELNKYMGKSSLGMAYHFTPQWGQAKPTRNNITVVARYIPPQGSAIYSSASTISVPIP